MAKRPAELAYWVDEVPPPLALGLLSLQHLAIVAIFLIVAVSIVRTAGLDAETGTRMISLTMIAGGIGTILQSLGRRGVGSGFLVPSTTTTILLPPSTLALAIGGPSLLFGMSVVTGLVIVALSRVIHRLRPLFPTEVAGFVVFMIGITVLVLAQRQLLGVALPRDERLGHALVGLASFGVIVAVSVWATGRLRLYCSLVGVAVGYALDMAAFPHGVDGQQVAAAPLLALPQPGSFGLAFDAELILPFLIAALAITLNTVGAVTAAQRANDAEWKRPDMANIGRGVLAEGLSNVAAGLIGGIGQSATSSAVGLSVATAATSRAIGFGVGALLIGLSFSPKMATLLLIMPGPVIGASLLFSGCFLVTNGMQMIASRLLDSRKVFTLGVALSVGMIRLLEPAYFADLPGGMGPWVSSPLALAITVALALNAVFRIGIHRRSRFAIDANERDGGRLASFMTEQGKLWGAAPEVVFRASFAVHEAIEALVTRGMITADGTGRRPVEVRTRFDEFAFTVTIVYQGTLLEPLADRPSDEDILESSDGVRLLAAFLIGRSADHADAERRGGRNEITLGFDA